jgi:hypothetical protein
MTDSQLNLNEQRAPWGQAEPDAPLEQTIGVSRRTNAEAIAAGLVYLLEQRRNRRWGHLSLPWGAADAPVTACVLARLGELPSHFIGASLRGTIADSLDWLQQARTSEGGWGYPGGNDAESTAWAVIALRKHARPAPDSALELIRRCRRPDGGFASDPEGSKGTPDATALAIHALGAEDGVHARDAGSFVSYWLSSEWSRLTAPLSVCAGILEWEKGLATFALLNQVCRLTADFHAKNALEQALLLRCLVRLRVNRAWSVAADLRAAQLADGSWPGPSLAGLNFDDKRIISTVTAVSALALGDFQPGLYFGSDLPRPRRLHES